MSSKFFGEHALYPEDQQLCDDADYRTGAVRSQSQISGGQAPVRGISGPAGRGSETGNEIGKKKCMGRAAKSERSFSAAFFVHELYFSELTLIIKLDGEAAGFRKRNGGFRDRGRTLWRKKI